MKISKIMQRIIPYLNQVPALFFAVILIVQGDAVAGDISAITQSGYAILTNFGQDSPYFTGVQKLKNYRNAQIIHFENDPFSAVDTLRALQPSYVAVLIGPTDMDEGFAYDIFVLAKQMDDEYDTDFSYGFITGNNPQDVENYIDHVIQYESGDSQLQKTYRCFWRTGPGAVGGGFEGNGHEFTAEMVNIASGFGLDAERVNLDSTDREDMFTHLKNSGILHLYLHGDVPHVENIAYNEIPQLDNPVIILNSACFCGCTSKYYNQNTTIIYDNYEDRAVYLDPEMSFTLSLLNRMTF